MADTYPKVGIGVLVFKNGNVLLGQRKSPLGLGQFGGPGGKLEPGESFEDCAAREVREEAGVEIMNIRPIALTNLIWNNGETQYVDIGMAADWVSGEPQTREPDKCAGWGWYSLERAPENLFGAEKFYFEAIKTGKFYFETKRNA